MSSKLWFSHTIEGLFLRGLGARLTPPLRERVKAAGIDLGRLEPAYPVQTLVAACRTILPDLYPGEPEHEAFRQLGVAFTQGYNETLVGGALIQIMKVIGPRRTLERMQRNFRTGGNYVETKFTALGATSVELWVNDVTGMAGLYQGMIEEGARLVGTKGLTCRPTLGADGSCTYRVDWTA